VLTKYDPEVIRLFLLSAYYRKSVDFTYEKLDELVKAKNRIVEAFGRLMSLLRWRAEEREENWLKIWKHYDKKYGFDQNQFLKDVQEQKFWEVVASKTEPADILINASRFALYQMHRSFADDFTTQGAIGELFLLVLHINRALDRVTDVSEDEFDAANIALGTLAIFGDLFGILRSERNSLYYTAEAREITSSEKGDSGKLEKIILNLRQEARAGKNFALADMIRDMLGEAGAEVRDTVDGSKIVWK
ncbi:MAG: DALR domain-containing protein, partial [bacterium]